MKTQRNDKFLRRNLPVILAFLIVTVAMAVMFIARGIYPFGEEMYLRSDMYHQYAPFMKLFQRTIQNGDSLFFSWELGLGTNFLGTYSYYLASPINWIVYLFPSTIIPEIMGGFIIVKAGLMASTMTYYIREHFGQRDWFGMFIGIFYAFCSYMAAYSWNLMWLDCLVLLPLIVLGLERLVKENKVSLYAITLALCIFSNYYISIMICIFLVLYFIYLLICERRKGDPNVIASIGRFALYSVLAALIAGIILIPTIYALFTTASGNFNFPHTLKAYFNVFEMISRGVMLTEPTVLRGYFPNIYCTVSAFFFVPLYWLAVRTKAREKIGMTILLAIFLFSFTFNIPTYIWHGFHYPNSLSARHSFLYIFLLLVIVYDAMRQIKDYKIAELIICFICSLIAVIGLQLLFADEENMIIICCVNGGFLILYFIWAMIARSGKGAQPFVVCAMAFIVLAEAMINVNVTGYPTTSRTYYTSDNEDIDAVLGEIKDEDFYRVDKLKRRTKNDGAWSDYRSASEFSSTTVAGITGLYKSLGMQGKTNSYSYYGHTPLTGAILDVRYELAKEEVEDDLKTFVAQSGDVYLYKNNYCLAPGFTVNKSVREGTKINDSNPFAVQNSFVESACGIKDLYRIGSTVRGEQIIFDTEYDGRQFVYIATTIKACTIMVVSDGEQIFNTKFTDLENPQIIDIGMVKKGDTVYVESNDDDTKTISVIPGNMDTGVFANVMAALGKNQLKVTDYSGNTMSGTIHADEPCYMFTSIPYYEGWELYVDGERHGFTDFANAFVMVELEAGDHQIEFRYIPEGFVIGTAASILGLFILVLLLIMRTVLYPRKKKEE